MRVSRSYLCVVGFCGSVCCGCVPAPQLNPLAIGCYVIEADGWSAQHAYVTGFRQLPTHLALDTASQWIIRVPLSWRAASPPNRNMVSLSLEGLPWKWYGDLIVFDNYSIPHRLAHDSIIVAFAGWSGVMTAFLERREDEFTGIGFFSPLARPEDVPGIPVRLRRGACPADLS